MFNNFPPPATINPAFELATITFIVALLLLSLISLAFVFHLRFRSRHFHHLQSFNSLWTVRSILILFIALWAFNELLRLPIFREKYLYPFFPPLNLSQQSGLCRINVVLSLGLFQPAFLVTFLFLVNISIQKKTPSRSWAIIFVFATCVPVLVLQVLFVFFIRLELHLPDIFRHSSVVLKGGISDEMVLCSYPLMSSIVFGAFGLWYAMVFSVSCFQAVKLAINKGLRARIYVLAFTVMAMLPLELFFLGLTLLWEPEEQTHGAFVFLVFFTSLILAAVGEGILVIKPITDSLAAGGEVFLLPVEGQREAVVGVSVGEV